MCLPESEDEDLRELPDFQLQAKPLQRIQIRERPSGKVLRFSLVHEYA